ncbi:hypothetical protein KPH14_010385 [Odynerus spinipes]|uniref:Uncharacterized protein n=1 Tax=Odynerus spinipes TaxID=1348599 RepID=A0AAD9RU74_9HYME|nr:hypothetical protein KPH14_010385 [Odynerus spinipes]
MSGSGFRGRGIEPRGIHPNGLAGTFRGARLSHPRFYHPRIPHGRLPVPENWSGRSNHNVPFSSWKNTAFQHPMFRGKSPFHPNGRGRGTIHRGAPRFPNFNRPSIGPYSTDHNKNVERPRTSLRQDQLEQAKDESRLQQTPLLGSEEERQQKITETAVRLKQKLSNLTKEDITNLWQDDLSISSSDVENKSILNVGIPNLNHEQRELNLNFNDFKDIGRVDSDKNDGTNVEGNVSNFIQGTVKQVENSGAVEVIDLTEIEKDGYNVESMTVVNDTTENMSQNDNGQKLRQGTNSSHSISLSSSTVSETSATESAYSLQQNTAQIDLLEDQSAIPTENTHTQGHEFNTKCLRKLSHGLEYKKSDDKFNLSNAQKSCDDVHEQVNATIEMQYSLHRSVSKITKERTRWTQLPYETSLPHRKPFKSRWSHGRHNYMHNKVKNESTGFDSHISSPHLHRDTSSLCQDSQYNTSFNLSRCLPPGKFSAVPKLMHNQDNSQSILCLSHNTSSSVSNNVFLSQEHILQTMPAYDSWKPSPSAIGYNTCKENIVDIANFNPQQPPPNFNNQRSTVSPIFDSHFLSQDQSNLNIHALDSSQLSAVSASPTDLYCSVTFSTTQGTTTFSTLSQLSMTPSPNFLTNVPTNFSPILTYATPLQMTPYEIPSSGAISNTEHQTLLSNKTLDQDSDLHTTDEIKDELEEMQEAMQFAKQAMNITDMNNISESNQTLCSEAHVLNMSLNQENVSDASPSVQLHETINKEKDKYDQQCNELNDKEAQVITESHVLFELERETRFNQNCNVERNALPINEQTQTKVTFNVNPKLNKINKQEKSYQKNESSERETYVTCISQPNVHPGECSNEKKISESPTRESSWKNRIISRFLRMSKNDIRNMINNCSLRKFDIAMRHLVKEKRSSLSLEMRNLEDEKIKGYDREEFMNQLNAMLDPAAIVDITNLPTEFIRHLSEVLQLDTIPLESSESQHNNSDVLNLLSANEQEILNNGIVPNNIDDEEINDRRDAENSGQLKDHCNRITPSVTATSSNNDNNNEVTLVNSDKIEEIRILDCNQISSKTLFDTNDVHIDHITNDIQTVKQTITQKNSKKGEQPSLFNMTDLDDIFSNVTVETKSESTLRSLGDEPNFTIQANQTCEIVKTLTPTKTTNTIPVISKSKTSDSAKQHEYNSGKEYISKSERYNRWTRREREGPDAFRNLTKEEWEAKYGRQIKSSSNSCEIQTNKYFNNKHQNIKYGKMQNFKKNHSPHSFKRDRNYKTDIGKRILKQDTSTETISSTSDSSESGTDETSTSSDNRTPSDVTKLLKVIKEKEKIAKNKSLNETIRDEVTAEIQRKWNEEGRKRKYYRKDKRKKTKRLKYKKEKKKKRRKVFDSSCDLDHDKADKSSLLTETEIKKETISKEESDPALEKSIRCDINTVNNGYSKKQITTNVLIDEKVSLETKERSTDQDNERSTINATTIQPKTKAQLKLIPDTSKCTQESEFMKNTAKIVLNAKCKGNKITPLNETDKPKIIEKTHHKDKNASGINEVSEFPDNRLVDTVETAHTVFNNDDNTNKDLINTSIVKKRYDKEKGSNLLKEIPSATVEVQESNTKRSMNSKVTSKKIDIKAYKARALQRKMENEEKIKEEKSTISINSISKSIMEEKVKSNVTLKEKHSTVQISKTSTDSNKFKNIRSEGNKELKLKEKIKKKTEMETKVKETKEMSSVNQEKVNDISNTSKSLESKVDDDQLSVHIDKNECLQFLVQKISSQNKEIFVNDMISSKDTSKETEDKRDESIVSNINNAEPETVIMDKVKFMEALKITDITIQGSEVLKDITTKDLHKDGIAIIGKCDKNNKMQYGTRTTSTCSKLLAEHEICNFTNTDNFSSQKHRSEKSKMNEDLETQTNVDMSINSTNVTNMNVVPTNEQSVNLQEDLTITNGANKKLLENLNNLELQKVNSPESIGSPFKGFESNSCQHVEINNIVTTEKDSIEESEKQELQLCTTDKFNLQDLGNSDIPSDNNISFKNILNDSLNTVEQTYNDKERILCEKSSEMNEGTETNLNNIDLLNNGNNIDKKEEGAGQIFVHDCTKDFQNDEKNTNKIIQSEYAMENEKSMQSIDIETNILCTSTGQHKMLTLDEYEDNAIMEKSDIDILKDSLFKEKQLCKKNIDSICTSIDQNLLDINYSTISSCSEISSEMFKNVIDTETESSLSLLMEGNTTENNSAFKDIPNQNIIFSNIDSCEEERTNNNDLYLNNSSYANFSLHSSVSAERLQKSSTKVIPKKLQIPTKAALKESRNIFTLMGGSFSSVKETIELKDPHVKLNACNDQKTVDFLSDQISQKENIDNKIINLEQKKCSHNVHTYKPDDKDLYKGVDTDSLSKTIPNDVKTIQDEILSPSNHSSYIKELGSNNTVHHPVVELEQLKETNKWITNTVENTIEQNKIDEDLGLQSSQETNKQEKIKSLHKIKTKPAMKHKMKNKCKSNAVHITNTNIKEEIMARMIEIDLEIHKLMTEKMTLYQMLESDSLLSNKLSSNSNLGTEINKKKIIPVRLQTSSSSISHIMQNTETNFAEHSDSVVTSNTENALSEIDQNQAESKVGDTNTNNHKSLLQEENISSKQIVLSHCSEDRTISEDSVSSQSLVLFNDENQMQEDKVVLSEDQLKENQDTCSSIEEMLNNLTENSSLESISYFEKEEHHVSSPTDIKPANENQNEKDTSDRGKKQNVTTSKNNNFIPASLIYSDDSTWGSCAPSFEDIEQKKHNTGLALLEETYKREIAENRKLKASARKNKKKELDKFLKSVNYLTPEEEEIPLNTLYIKKLQQKRDLLDSLDDKKENSSNDNYENSTESEEIWKHVMEVINAVAEDRIKDLYVEQTKKSDKETLPTSSNTTKQKADTCRSRMPTNFNESLQSLSETQVNVSLVNCNQEQNSIKCSLNIIEKDILSSNEKEEEKNNENKKSNVQSTINSYNLEANPAMINTSSNDKITPGKNPLGQELFNADNITNIAALTEASGLNILNAKLNKNSEDTTVSILTSENLKCNNKTEETNKQKHKETDISKIEHKMDETIASTAKGTSNITKNLLKKCKDYVPTTTNSSNITGISDISRSNNIHDKKTSRRKNSNKSNPIHKGSKHTEDNMKYMECDNINSNGEKDSPKVSWHDSKGISRVHQRLESTSSTVKRNRNSQKLQNIKDKCLEGETSVKHINDQLFVANENSMERYLPNVDSQVSKPKVQGIAAKRKIYNQSEMMTCKVILIDILKSNKYQYAVNKFHANSTKTNVPYKSTTTETTTNSTHSTTSCKMNSSIIDTCKLKDIPKSKHSCISDNTHEQTSNSSQKHVTKVHSTLNNTKELESHHKVNALHNNECLSLQVNSTDISMVSMKPITSNVKTLLQQDRKLEIEIIEEKTKDQYHDEQILLSDEITENEQPLKTQYTVHKGPILDIKVFGDTFLAASEDGLIYRYSQISNGILNIYKGHRSAVTCLYIHKFSGTDYPKDLVYSGSLDGTLRCYNIKTGAPISNVANVESPVQCMDQAWGIIFIGTKSGHVSRFHIKSGVVKGDSIKFSNKSVLALKATSEGPRKVLIVASRNQPIAIRDAQNGLFLRTICGQKNHTVYSLMLNNHLIYCGTSTTSILVFDFTNGEQKAQYDAGVGIVCMRLYNKLLFAGCYDGNIYVFDIQDNRLICSIPGPGNMLLSMEVVDNKIIAGSKDKRLHKWQMPKQVQVVSHEIT